MSTAYQCSSGLNCKTPLGEMPEFAWRSDRERPESQCKACVNFRQRTRYAVTKALNPDDPPDSQLFPSTRLRTPPTALEEKPAPRSILDLFARYKMEDGL